jgi:hypothetical protein
MADNLFLRAALYYARQPWPVFPVWWIEKGRCACKGKSGCSPGKHPIIRGGRNSATTDPKIIKEWWKQYPKANIGIPTGPESCLVVVDIDPRNGGSRGDLERLGDFPPTPTAHTGGGGEHILLRHPGRKIKSKAGLGGFKGVDQKGDGGYIVAPPSNHISGGFYSWQIKPDTPIADIPAWLMPLLLQDKAKPQAQAQRPQQPHQGGAVAVPAAYVSKALADELAALASTPEGSRNARLNQAAYSLGQFVGARALDRGVVEAALSGKAAEIGLGEVESRATIRSGLEGGIKQPRQLPEKAVTRGSAPRQGKPPGAPSHPQPVGQGEAEPEGFWLCGHRYFVERGRLCLEGFDRKGVPYTTQLANFQARIDEEVSRDDGLKRSKEFQITGALDTGQALPAALVPVEKFDSLAWAKKEWGGRVAVAPGRSLGAHLVNAIQAHSRNLKRRTVYAHSGWRKIGRKWCYLHGGGAIGTGEPVEVDLGENLESYCLSEPGGRESAAASLHFLDVAPWEVTAPLLAGAYLAPFADLLQIDFSVWLFGPTGSMKSTLAALALCHFGNFTRLNLPGSWFSTVNSLGKLCHTLKDHLIVIDDFMPAASARDFQDMSGKAGRLIFQTGNRSARGRLAPDLSARPNYFPRGLILSTGEVLLPGQRQSATARYLGVELDPKKTPIDKARLTTAQDEAGLYAGAMASYLADVAPRLEVVQDEMRELWRAYRGAFQNGSHARLPEIQAWLTVGFEYAMQFFVKQGAVVQDEATRLLNKAWKIFEALGEAHSRRIEGERPTLKFLAVLRELFYTGRIFAESATTTGLQPPGHSNLGWDGNEPFRNAYKVGWADEVMLYLLPETVYRAVSEAIRAQGDYLSLGKNELLTALAREGFIEAGKNGKENTRLKWLQGAGRRVIWLPRAKLSHDEAMEEGEISNDS